MRVKRCLLQLMSMDFRGAERWEGGGVGGGEVKALQESSAYTATVLRYLEK